jgi:hypothetical protein
LSPTLKRYSEYAVLFVLALFLFVKGVVPGWTKIHSDFSNYYVSAKLIYNQEPIDQLYNNDWFKQKAIQYGAPEPGKFSPFPPATAWVMVPLAGFSMLNAQRIFVVVNLLFFGLGIYAIKKITKWKWQYSTIFILLSGLGLVNNFAFGQLYWIMTVCILGSYLWINNGKIFLPGFTLAAFTIIKYFPVVIVGGYFLEGIGKHRYIKIIAVFTVYLICLCVAQVAFFGPRLANEFFTASFLPHLDSELSGQGLYSFQFQSWDNLLRNLFVFHVNENSNPFINWPAGRSLGKVLIYSIVIFSMFVVLIKNRHVVKNKQIIFLALPALAALVILPVTATYHFVLLIFPLALLLSSDVINERMKLGIVIIYTMIGFIPYGFCFWLGKTYGVLFAYPRLLLVTLLYIFVSWSLLNQHRNA